MFRKLFDKMTQPVGTTNVIPAPNFPSTMTVTVPSTTAIPGNYVYSSIGANVAGNMTAAQGVVSSGFTTGILAGGGGAAGAGAGGGIGSFGNITSAFHQMQPNHIITFSKPSNQEIVRLNLDGSVEWANGIDVDAAAEAFGNSLSIGAEMRAGISKRVKLKMRDSVFEDLINIAKEKGSLSADDLTYLLEASKIVEKLKGGE